MALFLNEPDICGRPLPFMIVEISNSVLGEIFQEYDKYDDLETGGRLCGVYNREHDTMMVVAQIGPGPNARRTRTSFFQDGEYQEPVFRSLERKLPEIQHLGNWHTHHVNGLETLSQGDIDTYRRSVNSPNHAHDLWLALLVTKKYGPMNYGFKKFLLRRGGSDVFEV